MLVDGQRHFTRVEKLVYGFPVNICQLIAFREKCLPAIVRGLLLLSVLLRWSGRSIGRWHFLNASFLRVPGVPRKSRRPSFLKQFPFAFELTCLHGILLFSFLVPRFQSLNFRQFYHYSMDLEQCARETRIIEE